MFKVVTSAKYIMGISSTNIIIGLINDFHDDVVIWKCLPRYWPFVRGSHWSQVDSRYKEAVARYFDVFVDVSVTVEPAVEVLMICYVMTLMWRNSNTVAEISSLMVLYFLHSTSVLSFYTDVILTLPI